MAEFIEAYYKELEIYVKLEDYISESHYKKLFCPECHAAPIHIVKKQKTIYYASNRKDEHEKDCQHYEEFIPNKHLKTLINSENIEDQERLRFLINSNLSASLRLLDKNELENNLGVNLRDNSNQSLNSQSLEQNSYQKESISRVHIKNIIKKSDYINQHLILYGNAEISCNSTKRINSYTNEPFYVKQLVFKRNNKICFSIFLTSAQSNFIELPKPTNVNFAVFGLLEKKKTFFNLKIETTQHLMY
jgi:hypothetical protein